MRCINITLARRLRLNVLFGIIVLPLALIPVAIAYKQNERDRRSSASIAEVSIKTFELVSSGATYAYRPEHVCVRAGKCWRP